MTPMREMYDLFIDLFDSITDIPKWWKPVVCKRSKIYTLPLRQRPRCRWRPRESRRSLDGLSPGIVIIDEYAFAEEGGCKR